MAYNRCLFTQLTSDEYHGLGDFQEKVYKYVVSTGGRIAPVLNILKKKKIIIMYHTTLSQTR